MNTFKDHVKSIRRRRPRRLQLESMEARQLLTVIAVDDAFVTDEDMALTVGPDPAQSTVVLNLGSQWSYFDQIFNENADPAAVPPQVEGTYPSPNWAQPGYDDGAWPVGPGGFEAAGAGASAVNGLRVAPYQVGTTVFGIDEATNGQNLITTYLFRNTFDLTVSSPSVLTADFVCDDACVFYIDGAEVGRTTNMPVGALTTNTFATGTLSENPQTMTLDVSGLNLAVGQHTVAVELHQVNFTSSDAGFDMQLSIPEIAPILQNDNLTAQSGGLTVTADAEALDAADPNIVAGTVTMNADGSFTFTPTANYNGTATFDYTISDNNSSSTASVEITVNNLDDPPIATDDTYHFPTGATITTDVALSTTGIVLSGQTVWNYHDENGDVEFDAPGWNDKGWTPQDFNNFLNWKTGVGEFGFGNGTEQTTLTMGDAFEPNFQSYYFQHTFNIDPATSLLYLNVKRDDGVAIYINGVEVLRDNMPIGVIDQGTAALGAAADDGRSWTTWAIDTAGLNLTASGNSIAAEVHQPAGASSDLAFDLQMTVAPNPLGVLDNDFDAEDPTGDLTVTLLDSADADADGTLTFNADGTFTFVPDDPGFNGEINFTYQIEDTTGGTDTGTVTLLIGIQNESPVAVDDGPYNVVQGETLSTVPVAPPPTEILPLGELWSYLDNIYNQNADPAAVPPQVEGTYPVDWNQPGFDDSAWPSGRGGFEAGGVAGLAGMIGTTLDGIDDATNGQNLVTTYLFRTTFDLPVSNPDTLTSDIVCDDGCVIYIDGTEVNRQIGIPAGVVLTTNTLVNQPGEAFQTITIDVSALNLAAGEHTLAVELHQTSLTSSDVGFDMNLALPAGGISGVLANDTDAENDPLTVVGINGDLAGFVAGEPITLPSGSTLVMNGNGAFDYTAALDFAGTDTFTYQVQDSFGNTSTATATVIVDYINAPPTAVDDVYDVSQGATLSTVPVAPPPIEFLPFGATWSYLDNIYNQLADPAAVPPQVEGDYPVDWNQPGFDDAAWPTGPGGFEAGGVNGLAGLIGTTLDGIDDASNGENLITTYLFRTTFDLPVANPDTLVSDLVADDGVVIYIDGIEVFRDTNIPAGVLTTSTTATATLTEALTLLTMDVSALNLAAGGHTLAVELHQVNTTSSDVGFGMNLAVPAGGISGVLANDTDAENDVLTVVGINGDIAGFVAGQPLTLPSGSTLVMDGDGSFDYTGADDFDGADVFTYQVQDSFGNTSTATVTVNVADNPEPPVAENDSYALNNPSGTLTVPVTDLVLAQGSTWAYLDTIENENGVEGAYPTDWNLPGIDEGSWKTGPGPFAGGPDPAIGGIPAPATNLEGIDAAANGQNLITTYLFRTTFDLPVSNPEFLFSNFICDDGCVFYIDGEEIGRMSNVPLIPLTTSTLSGGQISEQLQSLAFDVSALNLAVGEHTLAVELHQSSLTSSDVGFEMDLSVLRQGGVLLNDSDPDSGSVLSVSAVNGAPADVGVPVVLPSGATLTMNADGSFDYAGDGDTGVDSFTYTVSDGTGLTDTATVTINIGGVAADPPQVLSVELNANEVDPPNLPKGPQPARWHVDTSVNPPLPAQRSYLKTINITFDQVVQSAGPSDFVLTNLGIKADMDPDSVVALDASQVTFNGPTVTISFGRAAPLAGEPDIRLPDGVYQLEILDTITNTNGEALDGDGDGSAGGSFVFGADATNNFYKLGADWNGDLGSSIFDFGTFAYWFGEPVGVAPEYADLNGDLGVSIFDFGIFSANFGVGVGLPTPFVGALDLDGDDLTAAENEDPVVEQQVAFRPTLDVQPVEARQDDRAVQDADRSDADEDDLFDVLASDVAQVWSR